ncbi:hypothetical protein J7643_11190 [bacterium]|nr:hypothetical protein [bacterium]
MSIKYDSNNAQRAQIQSNIAKVNDLFKQQPDLNVADTKNAKYEDHFKQADTNHDKDISRDELKTYVKGALSAGIDLSSFGSTLEVQKQNLDAALDDWFTFGEDEAPAKTEGPAATAKVEDHTAVKGDFDKGKTWENLRQQKISNRELLDFGHEKVDGKLFALKDKELVWADTGTKVSREQLAAMPDYQLKIVADIQGQPFDLKAHQAGAKELEALAKTVMVPDPTPDDGIHDQAKTDAKGREAAIAEKRMLNFGHHEVDGKLFEVKGDLVWADNGKKITPEQMAAMPDYQLEALSKALSYGHGIPLNVFEIFLRDEGRRQQLAEHAIR